jgi:hypothetical protein
MKYGQDTGAMANSGYFSWWDSVKPHFTTYTLEEGAASLGTQDALEPVGCLLAGV